ncbi:lipopolysaccharide biosynthesis protein [Pseudomonas sp. JZ134]|uniref:lipopolysaccharide biosynthesis protein n=1 Tax=Pseudomonas sp. JZ134 TaxID=2806615 RepID=UPI003DA17D8C
MSKFLLVFILAKYLSPEELGLYGLLTAAVGYSLYFLGFDFYIYTTRELIGSEKAVWGKLIKSQCLFSMLLYCFFGPLLVLVFVGKLLPWSMFGWFFLLLVMEHWAQELNRLLIAASEQVWASLILCLRSGLWAATLALWMTFTPESRSLTTVFTFWSCGGALALILGGYKLRQMRLGGWSEPVDWRWVQTGLKIVLPLLFATLAIRAVFTLDRYFFEFLSGLQALGAYVLFIGMCSALLAFLDAGVFAFSYPRLIADWKASSEKLFWRRMKIMSIQVAGVSMLFILASILTLDPLLKWTGKSIYLEYSSIFFWLLAATVLYGISMIPHYGLYSMGHDKPIIQSHIGVVTIFIVLVIALSKVLEVLAVPVSLCVAFGLMVVWKSGMLALRYRARSFTSHP